MITRSADTFVIHFNTDPVVAPMQEETVELGKPEEKPTPLQQTPNGFGKRVEQVTQREAGQNGEMDGWDLETRTKIG